MIVSAHSYLGTTVTSLEALECLRRDLIAGETVCEGNHRLRVWQALLLPVAGSPFTNDIVEETREQARIKQDQHRTREPDEDFDPLSNSDSWNAFYKDQELRAVILQDCERVFPEEEWFQDEKTQRTLQDCLFTWCKDNTDVSYKQGMHEVAALVTWVALHDDDCSQGHVYSDVYVLFSVIMKHIKKFYIASVQNTSPILRHANKIQRDLLQNIDPPLAAGLAQLDVEPQLYCMRWLRLLFIREFPLRDVLSLWDGMFAADSTLKIVDLISCAMLIRVRLIILESDGNGALLTLMRYPMPTAPVITFVQDALHLKNQTDLIGGQTIISRHATGNARPDSAIKLNLSPTTSAYTINALLEQTDKLGINEYVKVAVEEVRRNVTPIISETRQALARTHSRDPSVAAAATTTSRVIPETSSRDRQLAAILALVISNLKNGDPMESNISRLEDIKLILQGRKKMGDLTDTKKVVLGSSKTQSDASRSSLASEPTTTIASLQPQRIRPVSPIRIPAIRNKCNNASDPPGRLFHPDVVTTPIEHKDDIPLSISPKRNSHLKNSSNFSFLFADEGAVGSTFNRPRKV